MKLKMTAPRIGVIKPHNKINRKVCSADGLQFSLTTGKQFSIYLCELPLYIYKTIALDFSNIFFIYDKKDICPRFGGEKRFVSSGSKKKIPRPRRLCINGSRVPTGIY
jgi:hypothetical protein